MECLRGELGAAVGARDGAGSAGAVGGFGAAASAGTEAGPSCSWSASHCLIYFSATFRSFHWSFRTLVKPCFICFVVAAARVTHAVYLHLVIQKHGSSIYNLALNELVQTVTGLTRSLQESRDAKYSNTFLL